MNALGFWTGVKAAKDKVAKNTERKNLACVAALITLSAVCWFLNPAAWTADDSYFYLVIARNIALHDTVTFSGIMPTNGFHPLWGWLLGGWAKLLSILSPGWLSSPAFGVFVSFLCALLSLIAYQGFVAEIGASSVAYVVPIAFSSYFGVLSSEGHLSLLMLALLCWQVNRVCAAPSHWRLVGLAVVAFLTVMARLDNIFVAGLLLLFVTRFVWPAHRLLSFLPLIVFAMQLTLYMACNRYLYGGLMPVSGWMKSSFPDIFIQGFHGGSNPLLAGVPVFWGWVVMLVTGFMCSRIRGRTKSLMFVLLAGVAAKNIYIALFTRSHTGWYWYSMLDVFVLATVLSAWVVECPHRQRCLKTSMGVLACVCAAAMLVKTFTWSPPQDGRSMRGLSLIANGTHAGDTILVSDWPGYLAFHMADRNIIAADMLTSNRGWYNAMRNSGDAFDFIRQRCERVGKPLTHVLWNGNKWLSVDVPRRTITYYDPRLFPIESTIGEMRLDSDPAASLGDSTLWRL